MGTRDRDPRRVLVVEGEEEGIALDTDTEDDDETAFGGGTVTTCMSGTCFDLNVDPDTSEEGPREKPRRALDPA